MKIETHKLYVGGPKISISDPYSPPGGGQKWAFLAPLGAQKWAFLAPLGPQNFQILTLETPPGGVGGLEPNNGPLKWSNGPRTNGRPMM